ncbi:hypothetical protein ACF0H5_019078 [Mactra antiquata]
MSDLKESDDIQVLSAMTDKEIIKCSQVQSTHENQVCQSITACDIVSSASDKHFHFNPSNNKIQEPVK